MVMSVLDAQVAPREEFVATFRGVVLVFQSGPLFVIAILALTLVQGVVPALIVSETGRFLTVIPEAIQQGAASPAADAARSALVVMGVAIMAAQILGPVQSAILYGLQRRFHAYLSRRLMTSVSSLPGIAYHEDPEFRDKLEISQWVQWAPIQSLQNMLNVTRSVIQLFAFSVIVARFGVWSIFLLVALTVPEAYLSWRNVAETGWARIRRSDEVRKANYFRQTALTLEPAKELRIFNLGGWVSDRQKGHWLEGIREVWRLRRRNLLRRMWLHAFAVAGISYVYLRLIAGTLAGEVDVGMFAAVSMAVFGMANMMLAIAQSAAQLRQSNFYLPTALKLIDLPKTDKRLDASGTLQARQLSRSGVTFEGVGFTYPGTERKILDGLDLFIPAGSSIALVGENGAGKTTLIKLLCRFYDPDEGRILLDGTDIRDLDIASLRSRLAVIFQDFMRYHLPARDNVGFGAPDRLDDDDVLRESARRVGVLDRIEELEKGWETPLAREFGGMDLSGGEWQRVALARAMMAQLGRDADLLILDEPTASLDVRLEHELYKHFADLSRGRTTLLVSHRFSTVRMAERIVFMEDGRVVEDGTHAELMAAGRDYAQLYALQASHYRLTGSLE